MVELIVVRKYLLGDIIIIKYVNVHHICSLIYRILFVKLTRSIVNWYDKNDGFTIKHARVKHTTYIYMFVESTSL